MQRLQQGGHHQQVGFVPDVDDDEWDDLPLAYRRPPRGDPRQQVGGAASNFSSGQPQMHVSVSVPQGSLSGHEQVPNVGQTLQRKLCTKQRKKRKDVQDHTTANTTNTAAGPGGNNGPLAVPVQRARVAAPLAAPAAAADGAAAGAAPSFGDEYGVDKRADDREKQRTRCRGFDAGFCSLGDDACTLLHDGHAALTEESAWLQEDLPCDWKTWRHIEAVHHRMMPESPSIAAGIPPVLILADAPVKKGVAELACLAMEARTGRQLGRFHSFVRQYPAQRTPTSQLQDIVPDGCAESRNVAGSIGVGDPTMAAAVATVSAQGAVNPVSRALPLPDVMRELQGWIASLGLDAGPPDEAGFCERGQFRLVVSGDLALRGFSEWMGHRCNLQIPNFLRSWTDAALVCAREADLHAAHLVAGQAMHMTDTGSNGSSARPGRKRKTKPHRLPRSGLAGMLKFLGSPKDSWTMNTASRRGMPGLASLAGCAACLVQRGAPLPPTTRATQIWSARGEYEGTRFDDIPVPRPSSLPAGPGIAHARPAQDVRVTQTPETQSGPAVAPGKPVGAQAADDVCSDSDVASIGQPEGTVRKRRPKKDPLAGKRGAKKGGASPLAAGTPRVHAAAPNGPGLGIDRRSETVARQTADDRQGMRSAKGTRAWRRSIPVPSLSRDYIDYFVREKERQYYKSAGILPYRRDPATGQVMILLGSEVRKNRVVLSCLAGKREDDDAGPEHTAWREFWEESGKVLSDMDRGLFLTSCYEGRSRALWMQSAKMVVLACELNSPGFLDLPRCYACGGWAVDKRDSSMLALHWISAAELHHACHQRGQTIAVWSPAQRLTPLASTGALASGGVQTPAPQGPPPAQQPGQRLPRGRRKKKKGAARTRGRLLSQDEHGLYASDDQASVGGGDVGPGFDTLPKVAPGATPGAEATATCGLGDGSLLPLQLPLATEKAPQQLQQPAPQTDAQPMPQVELQPQQPNPQALLQPARLLPPPPMVPVQVEPFSLLRSLVADNAFRVFFSQLAGNGNGDQLFVPGPTLENGTYDGVRRLVGSMNLAGYGGGY